MTNVGRKNLSAQLAIGWFILYFIVLPIILVLLFERWNAFQYREHLKLFWSVPVT